MEPGTPGAVLRLFGTQISEAAGQGDPWIPRIWWAELRCSGATPDGSETIKPRPSKVVQGRPRPPKVVQGRPRSSGGLGATSCGFTILHFLPVPLLVVTQEALLKPRLNIPVPVSGIRRLLGCISAPPRLLRWTLQQLWVIPNSGKGGASLFPQLFEASCGSLHPSPSP